MMARHTGAVLIAAALALAMPRCAAAQVPKAAGIEFQVNAYTAGSQRNASVGCAADGDFAVVWDGLDTATGSVSTIFLRRFSGAGGALGSVFEAPTSPCGGACPAAPAFDASVCRGAVGEFVVVWERVYGADGEGSGVFGQRFDSAGAVRGSEFQVNTITLGYQYGAAVACSQNGNFTVVWQSEDAGDTRIAARRYNSTGAGLGTEFQVTTATTYLHSDVSIAADAAGNFVVAWSAGNYLDGPDGSNAGVLARRFSSAGTALAASFRVNSFTPGYQQRPAIDTDAAGNFVVAWESGDYYGTQDGSYAGIFAQRFDSAGARRGGEFQINTSTAGYQQRPALASDINGGFVVGWQSGDAYVTQDGSYAGIFARRFSSSGTAEGAAFQVNSYTANDQAYPALCADDVGNFVAVWDSLSQDGNDAGLFARRFTVPDISGHVHYYRGDRVVGTAAVVLGGSATQNTTTHATGGFAFAPGAPAPRTLSASKTGDLNNGVTSLDASWVLQYQTQLRTFDDLQKLACDVTGNGAISSLDAARILQFKTNIIPRLPVAVTCGSDWLFLATPASAQTVSPPLISTGVCQQGSISYNPLVPPLSDQDFTAILFGDCTGNWE